VVRRDHSEPKYRTLPDAPQWVGVVSAIYVTVAFAQKQNDLKLDQNANVAFLLRPD
jgi:hypothetical protein